MIRRTLLKSILGGAFALTIMPLYRTARTVAAAVVAPTRTLGMANDNKAIYHVRYDRVEMAFQFWPEGTDPPPRIEEQRSHPTFVKWGPR